MHQSKFKFLTREITITAGRDRIGSIRHHIMAPLDVESMTNSAHGCTMQILFGKAWNWSEFSPELKERYDAELADYSLLIPDQVTARTVLPPNGWYTKYVPLDTDLKAMREARAESERYKKEQEETANALILAQAEARARMIAEKIVGEVEVPEADLTKQPETPRKAAAKP